MVLTKKKYFQQEIREGNGGEPLGDSKYDPSRKLGKSGDVKPLTCNLCGKTFTKKGFLLRHVRLHRKERDEGGGEEADVDEDGDRFAIKRPYKPETRSYHCHLCGVVISRASKYYHMKYVHKIGFEIFKCFCGKEYSSKLGLKKHHLSHTGERPFICSFCGKTFRVRTEYYDFEFVMGSNFAFNSRIMHLSTIAKDAAVAKTCTNAKRVGRNTHGRSATSYI